MSRAGHLNCEDCGIGHLGVSSIRFRIRSKFVLEFGPNLTSEFVQQVTISCAFKDYFGHTYT